MSTSCFLLARSFREQQASKKDRDCTVHELVLIFQGFSEFSENKDRIQENKDKRRVKAVPKKLNY